MSVDISWYWFKHEPWGYQPTSTNDERLINCAHVPRPIGFKPRKLETTWIIPWGPPTIGSSGARNHLWWVKPHLFGQISIDFIVFHGETSAFLMVKPTITRIHHGRNPDPQWAQIPMDPDGSRSGLLGGHFQEPVLAVLPFLAAGTADHHLEFTPAGSTGVKGDRMLPWPNSGFRRGITTIIWKLFGNKHSINDGKLTIVESWL